MASLFHMASLRLSMTPPGLSCRLVEWEFQRVRHNVDSGDGLSNTVRADWDRPDVSSFGIFT
jgi:hypothetical protein